MEQTKRSAKKKVVIIGAGPGGLSAGMILAARGYDVHIYERQAVPGGRNASMQVNGFTFDIGPTFLLMKYILDQTFALAGKRSEDYLTFTKLDPMYVLNFPDAKLNVSSDHDKMYEEIKRVFPGDEEGFRAFLTAEKKKFDTMYPCLETDYSSLKRMFSRKLLRALPYMDAFKSVYDVAAKYFKHELLRLSFTFQAKYLGMSPWKCPGAFGILSYIEHVAGIYHVEGGLSSISEAMAKVITELGGTIHYNTSVASIETAGRTITGLTLANGEHVEGDVFVLNADFAYATTHLFKEGALKKYTKKKVEKLEYSCSTYMLYLGVDKVYDEPHHQIVFANDYHANLNDIFDNHKLSKDFSLYIRNATPRDATLAPEGKSSLYVLVPVPNNQKSGIDWAIEGPRIRKEIFCVLKERTSFTDLEEHIVTERIITPKDWEGGHNVFFGATFNLSHKLSQMLYLRPRNRFEEFTNCYLVGGGTHPGSGLPTIYESARISSNLIDQYHG
ncbi:MAG: hypothetical protein RL150_366 [Candidatus Parcubacteria bacterium]|jgi:phytoene desaturase